MGVDDYDFDADFETKCMLLDIKVDSSALQPTRATSILLLVRRSNPLPFSLNEGLKRLSWCVVVPWHTIYIDAQRVIARAPQNKTNMPVLLAAPNLISGQIKMPRYYVYGKYCWADDEKQAHNCMIAFHALLDDNIYVARVVESHMFQTFRSYDQTFWPHEPDFRTKPEPLPKEVTTHD